MDLDLHPTDLLGMLKSFQWFNATTVEYAPAMLCTKIAILLLYRRVFSPLRQSNFDLTLRIFMAILCLFYTATFFVKIWTCVPRVRIWDKSIPGKCLDAPAVLNTNGIWNLLTDIIILLIPMRAVWNLQLDTKRKIGITLVFTLGCLYVYLPNPKYHPSLKTSKSISPHPHHPKAQQIR